MKNEWTYERVAGFGDVEASLEYKKSRARFVKATKAAAKANERINADRIPSSGFGDVEAALEYKKSRMRQKRRQKPTSA